MSSLIWGGWLIKGWKISSNPHQCYGSGTLQCYSLGKESHENKLYPRNVGLHSFPHSSPIPYLSYKIYPPFLPPSLHAPAVHGNTLFHSPPLRGAVSSNSISVHYCYRPPGFPAGDLHQGISSLAVPRALLMTESASWSSSYRASWFSTVSLNTCRTSSTGLSAAKPVSLSFSAKSW